MVNTRILEEQLGWRRGQAMPGDAAQPPRELRHEPLLQGRIRAETGGAGPAPVGLAPRPRLGRAAQQELWAALEPWGASLDAMARAQGMLPPFDRDSAAGTMLDQLRAAQLRVSGAQGWRRIGVAAPRRGAGASFVALGLAAAVARLDYLRLLLLDLDLGNPSLHRYLGRAAPGPLEPVLRGEAPAIAHVGRVGANAALLLNDAAPSAPADLLHSPEALQTLRALTEALAPDLLLVDLPPLLTDPAAAAALSQVDAVLLVADGSTNTARDITDCERRIEGQTPLIGVVLNKSEDRPARGRAG